VSANDAFIKRLIRLMIMASAGKADSKKRGIKNIFRFRIMSKNIIVGMSGGVDSSVTAALLLEQGHQVNFFRCQPWRANARAGSPQKA
jgi:NH3-dependent NAD+ synthetase